MAEKVGKREKSGRKCREEGENEMLVVGDIDEKVKIMDFLTCVMTYTAIALGLLAYMGIPRG